MVSLDGGGAAQRRKEGRKDVERESLSRTSERNVSCSLKRSPSRVSALLPPSRARRARYLPPILLRRGNSRKRERKGASQPASQPASRRTSLAFYRHVRGEGATPLPPTAAKKSPTPSPRAWTPALPPSRPCGDPRDTSEQHWSSLAVLAEGVAVRMGVFASRIHYPWDPRSHREKERE